MSILLFRLCATVIAQWDVYGVRIHRNRIIPNDSTRVSG